MTTTAARRLSVEEVEHALDTGCLQVHYQPCYDLRTGEIVAVEALARILDPASGELLAPDAFLGVIEETGLITRLDAMVFAMAAPQVAHWRTRPAGTRLCLAINLSAADLDDPGLTDRVVSVAARAGLPLEAVIVELTETLLSRTDRGHEQVLSTLADLGCNITLDDFGTGNASFDYLRRFRVDGIKVDRSFVQFLGTGAPQERMAESLVRFCLSLGVHVVAEGIERPQQVAALRRLGCALGQGFLMSRPLDVIAFEALLAVEGGTSSALVHPAAAVTLQEVSVRRPSARSNSLDRVATTALAALLCLALVGIAVIAIADRRGNQASLDASAQQRLEAVDALAARQVDVQLGGLRDVVAAYARSDDVRSALTERDPGLITTSLAALGSATTGVFSSSLYDASGDLIALAPRPEPGLVGRNFAYRDWYVGARDAEGAYVSNAFQLLASGRPWALAVAAAVRAENGRITGYVVATMALTALQAQLDDVLDHHGISVTLVDSRDVTLAAPDGRIGLPTSDPRLAARREDSSDPGDDAVWSVHEVAAIGGWLLAEQPSAAALGSRDGRLSTGILLVVVGAALVMVLLWLGADGRRRRLKSDLRDANDWLMSIMTATPTPLVITDGSDLVHLANPAAGALLAVPLESLVGQDLTSWLPTRDQPEVEGGGFQARIVDARGEVRLLDVRSQEVGGPLGELMYLHALVDVTPHRQEQDRLRAKGRVDPLTGIGNRLVLDDALAAALTPGGSTYALVMLDLDGFKGVNDLLGHAAGDSLLCAVAESLSGATARQDSVTRIGGDEFMLVVRVEHPDECSGLAVRLRAVVQRAIDVHSSSGHVRVGVSVGAVLVSDETDATELMRRADQLMYDEKRAGRLSARTHRAAGTS
ncbi:EAL domain-containing protein [Nocardioides sp. WS12]|uniref:EAL domain-containing protein n=1 Tax=Nocardioides sp. WS12 TaxID=2486272 RepID=UPI0015FE54BC|nr:EAL domain-containing protein [Nocardioides sp. WS12]